MSKFIQICPVLKKKKESAIAQLRRYDALSTKWPSCIVSPSKYFLTFCLDQTEILLYGSRISVDF